MSCHVMSCMHACMHAYVYIYIYMCVRVRVCINLGMYAYIYIHIYCLSGTRWYQMVATCFQDCNGIFLYLPLLPKINQRLMIRLEMASKWHWTCDVHERPQHLMAFPQVLEPAGPLGAPTCSAPEYHRRPDDLCLGRSSEVFPDGNNELAARFSYPDGA